MSETSVAAPFWRINKHDGARYTSVLSRLHEALRPRTYLEIGTRKGGSLALATCASIAVDPKFEISSDVIGTKRLCGFYQVTSDAFFADHDPKAILGGPIDLAFLDGLHLYEFLLRDFINTERHCRKNSVIAVHDCIPVDMHVARRNFRDRALADQSDAPPAAWAGDVWKAVAILHRYRPDLRINAYMAPPTGLVTITNLDPQSDVLSRDYAEAVEAVRTTNAADFEAYIARLKPEPTAFLDSFENVAERYWL